jgi:predicted transcriptional regulator
MSRDSLDQAADAVNTAIEVSTDEEIKERLDQLGSKLESQATRDTTPALGILDRVQTKLREIGSETQDQTVAESLADAREHILSFLGTLDDRGMKQH